MKRVRCVCVSNTLFHTVPHCFSLFLTISHCSPLFLTATRHSTRFRTESIRRTHTNPRVRRFVLDHPHSAERRLCACVPKPAPKWEKEKEEKWKFSNGRTSNDGFQLIQLISEQPPPFEPVPEVLGIRTAAVDRVGRFLLWSTTSVCWPPPLRFITFVLVLIACIHCPRSLSPFDSISLLLTLSLCLLRSLPCVCDQLAIRWPLFQKNDRICESDL